MPTCDFEVYQGYENLFEKKSEGDWYTRFWNQFSMIFNKLGSDGGLFIVIGRKK